MNEIARVSLSRFDRVVIHDAVRSGVDEYDDAQLSVLRILRRATLGRGSAELTPRMRRSLSARVRRAQINAARSLATHLVEAHSSARSAALRNLLRTVGRMEGSSTALAESPRFAAILNRNVTPALTRIAARQTTAVASAMETRLRMAELEGATTAAAVRSVELAIESERWRIERVARTEASFAYNSALDEGIDAMRDAFPDIRARWTEHVNDSTWMPMDDRVAADSMALHGQVKRPGRSFIMPADGPADLIGNSYDSPPNRPNDRAVLTPWRRSWGIPAYEVRDGRKVWLTRRS